MGLYHSPFRLARGDSLVEVNANGSASIKSLNASALVVGANGATNPVFQVDAAIASVATGIKITGAAAAGGVTLAAISSGANEELILASKAAASLILRTNSLTRLTVASTGAVTIAAPDSGTGLTVSGGGITVTAGGLTVNNTSNPIASFTGDSGFGRVTIQDNATNSTDKKGRLGCQHYLTAEEPFFWVVAQTDSTAANVLSLGGGTSAGNAATQIRLYTAANYTTQTGTVRMTIASTGAVTIAAPDSGVGLTVSGGGITITGTATLNGLVTTLTGTAITAGGVQAIGVTATTNFGIYAGSGAPTISAAKGSIYLRSDGTGVGDRLYVNTNGGTTWTAVTTVA